MEIGEYIKKLRKSKGLTLEKFGELFGVSHQSVQKWESGAAVPEVSNLVRIAKYFDASLDEMLLGRDKRLSEIINYDKVIKPSYEKMHIWEDYSRDNMTEFQQSMDEGLDIAMYEELFKTTARLPRNQVRGKLGDLLFEIVSNAPTRDGYKYTEPDDIEKIMELRNPYPITGTVDKSKLQSKIHGAWMGRIAGCYLGKNIEGIKSAELVPFLKASGNYPMHRYIMSYDVTDEIYEGMTFKINRDRCADKISYMLCDDDTNYTVLAQELVEKYGRDFTSDDIMNVWLDCQTKNAYCTAERVAYCNFIKGYTPPKSATHKNPYREWIGAQIRGDYFGYINPGNMELAAEMAWRDGRISHVKNGIYGEMFIAAMIAAAALTDNMKDIVLAGLAEIPYTSRLYENIMNVVNMYDEGKTQEEVRDFIYREWDEINTHTMIHTISNAMIVVMALLYGGGDFGKTVCLAVQTAYDTDCNGATAGSIVGMAKGIEAIGEEWQKPFNDSLYTTVFSRGLVKISDCVKLTLKHIL